MNETPSCRIDSGGAQRRCLPARLCRLARGTRRPAGRPDPHRGRNADLAGVLRSLLAAQPRRHELLQRSPKTGSPRWRYGAECPPTFAHVPTGWKEWWRLIRVFTERWYRYPYLPDVGGRSFVYWRPRAFGQELPPSVREWVAFAYDVRGLWVEHDVLISDDHYVFGELVYRMEELPGYLRSCCARANGTDGATRSCMPILMCQTRPSTASPSTRTWRGSFVPLSQPLHGTLTYSVITLAMGRVPGGGGGFTAVLEEPDSILGELRGAFPVDRAFDRTVVFERENLLVVADLHEPPSRCHLSVACSSLCRVRQFQTSCGNTHAVRTVTGRSQSTFPPW